MSPHAHLIAHHGHHRNATSAGCSDELKRDCIQLSDSVCVSILLTLSVTRTILQPNAKLEAQSLRARSTRLHLYRSSLQLWNADTSQRHAVVAVENSGDEWPQPSLYPHIEFLRFRMGAALQKDACGNNLAASLGEHELVSLYVAMRSSVRIQSARTTHVLKLTGRYYMPGLSGHLAGLSPSHMIVRQGTPSGARCEAMGCRRGAACDYLWRCPYKNNHHCEATIRYRMRIGSAITPTKTGSEIFQLPPSMPIAPTLTGTGGVFRNRLDLEGNKTDDDKIMAEWGKSKLGG